MSEVLAYLAAVALAATFAVAAAAKLTDRPATARGFRALGLPAPYFLALLVPMLEASLAALLVVAPAPGAGAAVVLLALFSALIAGRLAQGVHAPCACFGGSGGPLSWRHLARNGGMILVALVALMGWPGGLTAPAALVGGLAVAATVTAVYAGLRHRPGASGGQGRSLRP